MGGEKLKKLLHSTLFIILLLFISIPINPSIARNETFEDIPLIIINFNEIVDVSKENPVSLSTDSGIKLKRALHLWQVGEDVLQIRKALKKIGYTIGTTSYIFDENMKNVISKFQLDHELKADGIVGKETVNVINKILLENNMTPPSTHTVVTNAPTVGYWIIINKSSNTLILLKGKSVVKKFPVATGKDPDFTPEGKWKVQNKVVNPAWKNIRGGVAENPLGYRWIGLNIDDGYLYGIHGTNNEGSIGYFISKGCIRMQNEDVESLFPIIKSGTPVWVGTNKKLKSWGIN